MLMGNTRLVVRDLRTCTYAVCNERKCSLVPRLLLSFLLQTVQQKAEGEPGNEAKEVDI